MYIFSSYDQIFYYTQFASIHNLENGHFDSRFDNIDWQ